MTGPTGIPDPDQPLPTGEAKATAVRSMFDAIAPRYDLINRIMTFRLDVRWRKRTVRRLALPDGSAVLDLACGTGDLCRDLAAAYGYDADQRYHPQSLDTTAFKA